MIEKIIEEARKELASTKFNAKAEMKLEALKFMRETTRKIREQILAKYKDASVEQMGALLTILEHCVIREEQFERCVMYTLTRE